MRIFASLHPVALQSLFGLKLLVDVGLFHRKGGLFPFREGFGAVVWAGLFYFKGAGWVVLVGLLKGCSHMLDNRNHFLVGLTPSLRYSLLRICLEVARYILISTYGGLEHVMHKCKFANLVCSPLMKD